MSSKKRIPRGTTVADQLAAPPTLEGTSELLKQVNKLQLEVDILKETINVLKKDPGADMTNLSNCEKAVVVGALRTKYTLPILLHELDLPRSSCFYQQTARDRSKNTQIFAHKSWRYFMKKKNAMAIGESDKR